MKMIEDTVWIKKLRDFWAIYKTNMKGVIGLAMVLIFVFIAIISPYIVPYDPFQRNVVEPFAPPSKEHRLGGDDIGRDLFSQMIFGSRISLFIGFVAAFSTTLIGTIIGTVSGYFGGYIDDILVTFTNIILTIPSIPIMLVLAMYLGPNIWNIITVIAITNWTGVARIIRSQVLSLKERAYVDASRAIGAGSTHIITKHILPNAVPLILANAVLRVVSAILSEAGLSFLGLGDPTAISWGTILHYAQFCGGFSRGAWWWIIPPGLLIGLVAISFTLIGYSLEEVFGPRLRRA